MGGLWEQYDVTEVASPEAWRSHPELVLRFYNERRKILFESKPNAGHEALVQLEKYFQVSIITQNVDDLHEVAGSSSVVHLHGELRKARSTVDESLVYTLKNWELNLGDLCEKGSQLRPHIVWFGEEVPNIQQAAEIASTADLFLVVGTSLNVYPAAGLIDYAPESCPVFVLDPNEVGVYNRRKVNVIKEKASTGMPRLAELLIKEYAH